MSVNDLGHIFEAVSVLSDAESVLRDRRDASALLAEVGHAKAHLLAVLEDNRRKLPELAKRPPFRCSLGVQDIR